MNYAGVGAGAGNSVNVSSVGQMPPGAVGQQIYSNQALAGGQVGNLA